MKKVIVMLALVLVACAPGPKGDNGQTGADGLNGVPGQDGARGVPGPEGKSALFAVATADVSICPSGGSVLTAGTDLDGDNALELIEVEATAVICNGAAAPTNGFEPVELVSACGGLVTDSNNELFLRLANGLLIGSVSENVNGLNTHFGIVAPGTWMSTGSNGHTCVFTVDENYNISQN